jgi:hypothetical protein
MKTFYRKFLDRFFEIQKGARRMENIKKQMDVENQRTRLLLGRMLANQIRTHGIYQNIHDSEFQVFSQFGDDGILQYLIDQAKPSIEKFIEFGVENYSEANTRFLLLNNNWSGLIIDGDPVNMDFVRRSHDFWRYDLQAVSQFIDRDNINALFEKAGFTGEIGLLSVDIDGNDYWVWEAIHVVNPVIVTVEYNSVFGAERAVTIPYDGAFNRTSAHFSNLYWGTSLKALCLLAEKKGYSFVGCNSAGNNAHFVRKDKVGRIPVKRAEDGFVESKFRESRDKQGNLTYLREKQRLEAIKHMKVFDVEREIMIELQELI